MAVAEAPNALVSTTLRTRAARAARLMELAIDGFRP